MNNSQNKIEVILSAVDRGLKAGISGAVAGLKSLTGSADKLGNRDAFGRFTASAKSSEKAVISLDGVISGMMAKLAGLFSVAAGAQKLVAVTREFDKISSGLITATGSAEKSEAAFAAIQDFAAKTPYDLAW